MHDPVYQEPLPFARVDSFELTSDVLPTFDIVLILVDHSDLDWEMITQYSSCIIDTRNVISRHTGKEVIHL